MFCRTLWTKYVLPGQLWLWACWSCAGAMQLLVHSLGLAEEVWLQEKPSGNKLMGLWCCIFMVGVDFFLYFVSCLFYFLSLSLEFTLYPTLLPVLGLYRISTKAELELDSSAHACPMVKQVALAMRIMSLFPWSDHREINQSLYIMRQLYELMIKFSYSNCNSYAFYFQPEQIWHRLWPGQ